MRKGLNKFVAMAILLCGCGTEKPSDGATVESSILSSYNLTRDYGSRVSLSNIIKDVNCSDSAVLRKRLVFSNEFRSWDTSEILLIPYISDGKIFKSSAYSDIDNRYVLINPSYIHEFALKNTLNDSTSFVPLLELMLLHEMGHFILKKSGAFDKLDSVPVGVTGQQEHDNTQPEYLTTIKKVEFSADSLAIDLVKRQLNTHNYNCMNIAFDVERVLPGMQFQISGMRMIDNFGNTNSGFLHDPSNDHPNLELRVTFMNYFLFPSDSLKQMIDDYLYNRTIGPVHQQELDPRIFQEQEKKLPAQ